MEMGDLMGWSVVEYDVSMWTFVISAYYVITLMMLTRVFRMRIERSGRSRSEAVRLADRDVLDIVKMDGCVAIFFGLCVMSGLSIIWLNGFLVVASMMTTHAIYSEYAMRPRV